MSVNLWSDLTEWWRTVTPDFAFLLALPLLVAAAGGLADWVRRRRRR